MQYCILNIKVSKLGKFHYRTSEKLHDELRAKTIARLKNLGLLNDLIDTKANFLNIHLVTNSPY